MIDEQGQVTNIVDGKLAIKVTSSGSCESCPIHGNCYSSDQLVWVPAKEGIRVNDHVRFSILNTSVLKMSTLVYGLPLVAVFAGILLGYLWIFRSFGSDPKSLLSFGMGVLFFFTAGFVVSRLDRNMRGKLQYAVTRVQPPEGAEAERSLGPAESPESPSGKPSPPSPSSAGSP